MTTGISFRERQEAVMAVLRANPLKSDQSIASELKVGFQTVAELRKQMGIRPTKIMTTTLAMDLLEVLKLYDAGALLTVEGMKAEHKALRRRVESRSGESWLKVFQALLKMRPQLDHRRFFARAPEGMYVDLQGKIVFCTNPSEIDDFATRVFSEYAATQPSVGSIAQVIGDGPVELRNLYARLVQQGVNARTLIEKATGRKFPVTSVHSMRFVPGHLLGDGEHPPLDSYSELVVDTALAGVVPDYYHRHSHGELLTSMLPLKGVDWALTPYTGMRSPRVDIVVDTRLVVEVSFGTEAFNRNYNDKLKWKMDRLREGGFEVVNIRIEDGAKKNAEKLEACLRTIGIEADQSQLVGVLWSASFEPGYVESKEVKGAVLKAVSGADVRTMADACRALAAQGLNTRQIAEKLQTPYTNVYAVLRRCGLLKRDEHKSREVAIDMHANGKTLHEIAGHLGCSYQNVVAVLQRAGVLEKSKGSATILPDAAPSPPPTPPSPAPPSGL